jgi:hypothetical protein
MTEGPTHDSQLSPNMIECERTPEHDLWRRRAARQQSLEDEREIGDNLTGFFLLLVEWDRGTSKKTLKGKRE